MASRLPTEATAAAPAEAPDGLDVARGLQFFGGDPKLFRRALTHFVASYGEGLSQDRNADGEPGLSRLLREVHALAGVAAVIGAAAIMDEAAGLENAMLASAGPPPSAMTRQLHASLIAFTQKVARRLAQPADLVD